MKTQIVFLIVALLLFSSLKAQVKIGNNPQNLDPASVLELESSNRVLVITRVTTAQMSTINPLRGALVYNTDEECIHYYNGVEWINICEALDNSFTVSSEAVFNTAPDARDSTIVVTQTETPDGINYNFEVNQITGDNVYNGTLFGSDLAPQTVGVREIQNGSVGLEKLEDGTLAGQLMQWNGTDWTLISEADISVTELDGVVGNEVTDATAGGSLERSGAGTEFDPFTLDIADDGVTAAKINGDVAGIGLLQNGTTGALDVDYANIEADWGNITNIPPDVADGDNQNLSIGGSGTPNQTVEVLISGGTGALIGIQDGDFDPNNEIQDAIDVDFDDTASTLGETTVQGAIDALAASNAADGDTDDQNEIQDAIDVDFDDTASTLGETTVQGAIDALAASNAADSDTDDQNEIQDAIDVDFDDTASTLGETTVQGAIDALAASNAADGDTDDQNEIQDAIDVDFDDTASTLGETTVQGAIDALAASNAADGDTDDQNELSDLNLNPATNILTLTNAEAGATGVDLSTYLDNTNLATNSLLQTPASTARDYNINGGTLNFISGNVAIGTVLPPTSTLETGGSFATAIDRLSGTFTLDETNHTIIITADSNITFPTVGSFVGRIYIIKNPGHIVNTSAYNNLDGISGVTSIPAGQTITIQSDGFEWQQID